MNEILIALIVWVAANSPYDMTNYDPPEVVRVSQEKLDSFGYADGLDSVYLYERSPYFGTTRIIYLRDDIDINNVRYKALLAHELVHDAQWYTGAFFVCNNHMEFEAYTIHQKYLTDHGSDRKLDIKFINNFKNCFNDYK